MVVLLFEITTSRWRSCVATRHATDGRVTIDGVTSRHSSLVKHSRALCALHSNSGNRGMQKDMPDSDID
jgi:hypothetical protein